MLRWIRRRRAIAAYLAGQPISPQMQSVLDGIAIEQDA